MSASELGGVGEGLCVVDKAEPLTQLRLTAFAKATALSLRNPLPLERAAALIGSRPFPVTPATNRSNAHAIRYT